MLITRTSGLGEIEASELSSSNVESIIVDDNFNRLCQTIEAIPKHHPYSGFQYVQWFFSMPIPRFFWPNKPLDYGFNLAPYLGFLDIGLTTSVIGEFYVAFGFIGCFLGGIFYGYIANLLLRLKSFKMTYSTSLTYSIGLVILFIGIRSGIELIWMGYTIFSWFFIMLFFV